MLKSSDQKTINKLKQILASRYGMGLELRTLTSVTAESEGANLLGHDLLIPLRIKDAFLGTAVIPSAGELSLESRAQITQMVRMILEPALYRDFLERRENNLRSLAEEDIDVTNLRVLETQESDEFVAEPSDELQMEVNLVHLQSQDPQKIKKAALLLHEMTGRWAFVPFNDVKKDIHSVEDLMNLGAMTLYVENVRELDEKSQQLILDYLSAQRSDRDALFVTSDSNLLESLSTSSLKAELIDEMLATALELDRTPLSEKALREVFNLMFFTLPEPV